MPVNFKAAAVSTSDKGVEFFNAAGAVIIHVDGNEFKSHKDGIFIKPIVDSDSSDTYKLPQYEVELPDNLEIVLQHWSIVSAQSGSAGQLLEFIDEDTPDDNENDGLI